VNPLPMRRRPWIVGLFVAAGCALPATAQQTTESGPVLFALPPHPTDTGKPVIYDPQFVAKSDNDARCAAGSSCRLRLLGVIQNNGAVELRARAFTW
jgi:hypothetical protein